MNEAKTTPVVWSSASSCTINSVDGAIDFINWRKPAAVGRLWAANRMKDNKTQTHRRPSESLRGFWSLFATQFQGAFNDNAFKFIVIFMVLGKAAADEWAPLVGLVFAVPFILFSAFAGQLATCFSKRTVTVGTKVAEVGIMILAILGFVFDSDAMLVVVVFLLSSQSAFFGPSKYGLLPELLPEKRLSWGNGVIQLGTTIAIIAGTVIAGMMYEKFKSNQHWSGVVLLGLSFAGLLFSTRISRVKAAAPDHRMRVNPLPELANSFSIIRRDRPLFLAVIGESYFWLLGALMQFCVMFYGKELGLPETEISYMNGALACGIGIGCFLTGYLSRNKIEYGFVPIGVIGLTVSIVMIPTLKLDTFQSMASCLTAVGFFGGFYLVPLATMVQQRPDIRVKGAVIALNSTISFVGVALASIVYYVCKKHLEFNLLEIFMVCGFMTFAAGIYIIWLLPDSLVRLVGFFVTRTIYRLNIVGRDNIPGRGGALFVSNHLSFIDVLLLQASTDRPIRFIMYAGYMKQKVMGTIARIMRCIPISSEARPRDLIKSLKVASQAIRDGEVVCIFAEGQITRTGQMLPFRRGYEKIMKDVDAPIIPIHLDGVWGSIFSYSRSRFFFKLPRRIPYRVTVSYGAALPHDAPPVKVREAVQELGADAWAHRKRYMKPLHRSFVRAFRKHPFQFFAADAKRGSMRCGGALVGAVALGQALRRRWAGQEMVGILMPPTVAGALVNYAASLGGRVPVNLNYTLSAEAMRSCIEQCDIRTVVTSKAFLAQIKLDVPVETVFLEDVAKSIGICSKLVAALAAALLPVAFLEKFLGTKQRASMDDLATVIFSSGSTGTPKGVMLSHYNVVSNIQQIGQAFALDRSDRILGILPFFHSFGFTGTLWLPALLGAGAVYHSNPVDGRGIGELVGEHRVTFLLATPTFLQIYMRACTPEQFGSVQFILAGAEKLPERLAAAFEDRFGLRPMEGYGTTETSPVVTINTRDFRSAGFRQVGAKRGSIGHPLPGMVARIIDPDTGEPLALGQAGLLLVKGPNVMQGYIGQAEKTAEVLRDGWYKTGDIAAMDEDGFLAITDRLSRFSKIGGEMVPHIKVEENLHELGGLTEQTFVVTGVPDEKKGERLVVLYQKLDTLAVESVVEQLAASELPNIWKPRRDQFFEVETLPYLGTGKLDLKRIKAVAAEFSP